jgi:hypothetical protein
LAKKPGELDPGLPEPIVNPVGGSVAHPEPIGQLRNPDPLLVRLAPLADKRIVFHHDFSHLGPPDLVIKSVQQRNIKSVQQRWQQES